MIFYKKILVWSNSNNNNIDFRFRKNYFIVSIVEGALLSMFQVKHHQNALASGTEDPDRISTDRFDICYRMHDLLEVDLKKHFETGMEESDKDNWASVNHDIYM